MPSHSTLLGSCCLPVGRVLRHCAAACCLAELTGRAGIRSYANDAGSLHCTLWYTSHWTSPSPFPLQPAGDSGQPTQESLAAENAAAAAVAAQTPEFELEVRACRCQVATYTGS